MAENIENTKEKKYVARRFVPKAYYNIYDWGSFEAGHVKSQEIEDLPLVERNPLADPNLKLVAKRRSDRVAEMVAARKAAAEAARAVKLRVDEEVDSETYAQRVESAAAEAASESVTLRFEQETEAVDEKQNLVEKESTEKESTENVLPEKESTEKQDADRAETIATPDTAVSLEEDEKHEVNDVVVEHVPFFRSIGAKLIVIISSIVVVALVGITFLVSYFVTADTKVNALENNLTINTRTASDTENRLANVESSVGMLLDLLEESASVAEQKKNASLFFERNKDIAAVVLPQSERSFVNNGFFGMHELETSVLDSYVHSESKNIQLAGQGNKILLNASPVFETSVIAFFYPVYNKEKDNCVVILYSSEALTDTYTSGAVNQSYLVNLEGDILIHPDLNFIMEGADFSEAPLVKIMSESKTPAQQVTYMDEGEEYIGAYKKLDNFGVITTVKSSVILEAVRRTTLRNIYLTFAILAASILIIYFFAKSLSTPLRSLTKVANEINKGNFNTAAFEELAPNRKDEVGVLIRSTKNEQQILNTFTRMTNRGVTQAIITKQIDFDPHLKDITIFFSDIRGFTAISDGFKNRFEEKSAGEIIGFLNDYMARMVNCITITGGNVDKFEGDAIMACWGVLRDDSLEFETMDDSNPDKQRLKEIHDRHVVKDALSAIRATVAMRYSLAVYNKDAAAFTEAHKDEAFAKYKPHIRIGSGLNSGRATVGFMGSTDKMEFTSIGDAVNLASRTESSNKPCGTDILITEDTYGLLKQRYIRCEENNFTIAPEYAADEVIVEVIPVTFEVKGKGKQHFYGVVNMPAFDIEGFFKKGDPNFVVDEECAKVIGPQGPETLHEVRTLLGIPEPDFGEVNLDEEENKIQIQSK